MTFKQKIHAHCLHLVNQKIQELENILKELDASAASDTKSSAGDKHETARAMVQIEQENTGKQLQDALEQKAQLEKINPATSRTQITKGSLVKTDTSLLYLSIGLGKINVDGKTITVISSQSPVGIKLMGLKKKNSAVFNGVGYFIKNLE